ncbi:hypothetical protein IQ06DRAFT_310784 [Phaeosphaeriaceae sp. SRC1lsM3a]|nr:hypothetical protein IQ06DRAFT_310784 [Stagonospora sp. SRC1lsM3a]
MRFSTTPLLVLGLLTTLTSAVPRPCVDDTCLCSPPTSPLCGAQGAGGKRDFLPPTKRDAAAAPVFTPVPPICRKGDCSCDLTSPQCKSLRKERDVEERSPVKICLPEDCKCNPNQPSCNPANS